MKIYLCTYIKEIYIYKRIMKNMSIECVSFKICVQKMYTYSYEPAAAVLKLSVLTSTCFILVSTLNEGAMCSDFVSITAFLNAFMYSSSPA